MLSFKVFIVCCTINQVKLKNGEEKATGQVYNVPSCAWEYNHFVVILNDNRSSEGERCGNIMMP